MIENYHSNRARDLGMPKGTGKRYSSSELRSFYNAAEVQYREATAKAQTEDKVRAYLDGQSDYNIYHDAFDPQNLSQLWTEAVEQDVVTTSERLFYMGVDILRIRIGTNWFGYIYCKGNQENLTSVNRFQRLDKSVWDEVNKKSIERDLPPSTYSLHFAHPAFVSPSDILSLKVQGEALPDEHIEVIRAPISSEWSKEDSRFYNQQFIFFLGMPITTHYRSRFYDEEPGEYGINDFGIQMHSVYELDLTPQQVQTFGRRLWQAHLNTPVAARAKSA